MKTDLIREVGASPCIPKIWQKSGTYGNNGIWNGTQIVSSEWIERSHTDNPGAVPYGYLWSINSFLSQTYYFPGGTNRQKIIVVNEIDIVIVLTAHVDRLQEKIIRNCIFTSYFAAITS